MDRNDCSAASQCQPNGPAAQTTSLAYSGKGVTMKHSRIVWIAVLAALVFSPCQCAKKRVDIQLLCAAKHGDVDAAQRFLDQGADVNAKDEAGLTPLHLAAWRSHVEVARLLIQRGAEVNSGRITPLDWAASHGQKDVVKLLVANGADIHVKSGLCTPLHFALSGGDKDTVMLLVAKGADVHAVDPNGNVPLHCAVRNFDRDVVELLVAKGADVNTRDGSGRTPLDLAEKRGEKEVAAVLRKHGAKLGKDLELRTVRKNK